MSLISIKTEVTPTGAKYWRSLDQLADTPEFREWVEREFPAGASEMLDGNSRRTCSEDDGGVVRSCRIGGVPPAGGAHPSICKGRRGSDSRRRRITTAPCCRWAGRRPACWSRRTTAVRPKSKAIRIIRQSGRGDRDAAGDASWALRSGPLGSVSRERRGIKKSWEKFEAYRQRHCRSATARVCGS